jgi:3',5'-cyclic-AMP phosphodiesterase
MKRIAFLTDSHLDEAHPLGQGFDTVVRLERALADIKSRNITDIVFGGDIGATSAYPYFFEKMQDFNSHVLLGNHDRFADARTFLQTDLHKSAHYYKLQDEQYQHLFLDTSLEELSEEQLLWLQTAIVPKKPMILYVHHPILAVDTPVDKSYPLKNRDEVLPILLAHNAPVHVFCGHYHMSDESQFENVQQYITPALAFQIVQEATEIQIDNSSFGYRIIEIGAQGIETYLVRFSTV